MWGLKANAPGARGGPVLVTGASSGLGLETAAYLAERGFLVYATMRDIGRRDRLDEEARRRGVTVRCLQVDVTAPETITAAVRTIVDECGRLWAVVNNAGVQIRGYFEDLSEAEIRHVFDTNLFGSMSVTRAVAPHMRRAGGGRIVIVTSVAGRIGWLGQSAYCASKFALEGFGEALALEMAPLGVRVILIEPGIIKTDIWRANHTIARRARDPAGPYYAWFREAERLAERLVDTSSGTATDVAAAVCRAVTAARPRRRYATGRRASIALWLRRYVPGDLFDRACAWAATRRVMRGAAASDDPAGRSGTQLR